MSPKTSEPLRAQARTLVDAATAAIRWFVHPDAEALSLARDARLKARTWREASVAAIKDSRGPGKTDAADLSFSLREAVENAVEAVSDAAQWGVEPDAGFAAMCASLRDGAKALVRAAGARGPERVRALVEAKRFAAEVERARREVRAEADASPLFVEFVKRSEISSRLSAAAESLQQACDAYAGGLAE